MRHYCHNCGHTADLLPSAHCAWCLDFWTANHRWPTRADIPHPSTSLEQIYKAMGWEYPS
jgi:hypothetical protein